VILLHARDGVVHPHRNGRAVDVHVADFEPAAVVGGKVAEIQVVAPSLISHEGGVPRAIGVGVEVQVEIMQRVRRVVGVADRLRTREHPRLGVQANAHGVVGALLEVVSPLGGGGGAQECNNDESRAGQRRSHAHVS